MNVENLLQRMAFFDDWNKEKIIHQFVAPDKVELSDPTHHVMLKLMPIDHYAEMEQEVELEKLLEQCGFQPATILDHGLMADLQRAYMIKAYVPEHTLFQELDRLVESDHYPLGLDLGAKVHDLHRFILQDVGHLDHDWLDTFVNRVNLLRYDYAMLADKGDHDYLLMDMLDQDRYLLRNVILKPIHGHIEPKFIRFDQAGQVHLHGMRGLMLGDPIFDFRHLNHVAIQFPNFARGIVDGYYPDGLPRHFFKLLRLYSGSIILEDLIKLRNHQDNQMDAEILDKLFDMYADFSEVVPIWYRLCDMD